MYLCFIDEAGDSQAITDLNHAVQPALVVTALFVQAKDVPKLTIDFNQLKEKYFPSSFSSNAHALSTLTTEIKGDEIRRGFKRYGLHANRTAPALRFLDAVLALLLKYDVKMVARVWVKMFRRPLKDELVYTTTTQNICHRFEAFLKAKNSDGFVIADFRDPGRNQYVAHSIFTCKSKKSGDDYPHIVEIPTFGVSNNHATLQICDLVATTLLYPMVCETFCKPYLAAGHPFVHASFADIKQRYKKRLQRLQYHYREASGEMRWGTTVQDQMGHKSAVKLFQ